MKIRNIEDLEAFLKVADSQGFSVAARELKMPVSILSKRVSRLEETLGVRLFQRSTRAVQLTEEGRLLVPQAQRLLGDLKEIEDQFEDAADIKGTVRLTLPWSLSQGPVAKIITDFRKQHPSVNVHISFNDSIEKLVESGFDLAIRFSPREDSSLITKRLGPNYLKVVASPAYLKKHGFPKTVKELVERPLLLLSAHLQRKFQKSGIALEEIANQASVTSNNGTFLMELSKAGAGIAIRSHWDIAEALRRKELVEIHLNDRLESGHDAYIVTPSNRYMSKRVRRLMDALVEEFPKFLDSKEF